jgi:ankyrin repeat protein
MRNLFFLRVLAVLLSANFTIWAQPARSRSASAMSANFCLIKIYGTNACTAKCDMKVLSDEFKESSTEGFALLDGKTRQEMDMSQFKAQMIPPAAMKQMGIDQQIIILRPDLKLSYGIYPRLKSYVKTLLSKDDHAAVDKEPKMETTELDKEDVDGHPCVKNKVVVTTGGKKYETFVWFATDLKNFPLRIQTTEEDSSTIEVYTYKQIRFIKPDAKLFEPPAGFAEYTNFEEMMDQTQTNAALGLSDTNTASGDGDRLEPIVDFTLQNGTSRPVGQATAKAFGLGEEKIPATQLILSRKEDTLVHFFGVSTGNTNDLFIACIDRNTRNGTVWLTSRTGEIRATILTSTNGPPKVVTNALCADKFEEEINVFLHFVTPPPWEDAPHPLSVVAKFGDVSDVKKVFENNPEAINTQDDEGMTPLACAIVQEQMNVVRFLLDTGADPNIPDKNGDTPLGLAASRNKTNGTPLCEMLLAKGAEVNPTNNAKDMITPLSWAVSSDNKELVKLLLARGADPKARGGNILRSAVSRSDTEIVAMLIAHGADPKALSDGMTPLHDAADGGCDEVVKLLLSKGAEVNAKRFDGATPLMSAADREHISTVEILLGNGADINAIDDKGNTPLHWAVARENKEVVEILLAHGANINLKNKEDQTPMQFAARWHQPSMVEFLRQHGAKE